MKKSARNISLRQLTMMGVLGLFVLVAFLGTAGGSGARSGARASVQVVSDTTETAAGQDEKALQNVTAAQKAMRDQRAFRERFAGQGETYSEWSMPVNAGAPVNTDALEACPFLTKDGRSLYFTSTREGGAGARDIWVANRSTSVGDWGPPVNLGAAVNSASSEFCPFVSTDGHQLFFVSDRPGGAGLEDIYVSKRQSTRDDLGWGIPINLAQVNSPANDSGPWAFQNAAAGSNIFYFSSNRPGGLGGNDIYVSNWSDDLTFSPPTLVPGMNTAANEGLVSVRRDGLEILFGSNRLGGLGGTDLWKAERATQDEGWSEPVNQIVLNTSLDEIRPAISWDGTRLIFGSNRPGGEGSFDLYEVSRIRER